MKLLQPIQRNIIFWLICVLAVYVCGSASATKRTDIRKIVNGPSLIKIAAVNSLATETTDSTDTDNEVPVVTVGSPAVWESTSSSASSVSISGTAADDSGVISVSWSQSNGVSGVCTGTSDWSIGSIPLQEGNNLINITAVDTVGNVGATSVLINYSPGDPVISITSPTSEAKYASTEAKVTLSGNASADRGLSKVTWSVSGGASGNCIGTSNWTAADIPLAGGDNTITVTATDAGNISKSASIVVSYVDIVNPTVAISTPSADIASRRVGPFVKVTGTAADDKGLKEVTWSTDKGFTGKCNGTTDWVVSSLPLTVGTNQLTVTAVDNWDNKSTASLTITRLDSSPASVWTGKVMASLPIVPDQEDPKPVVGFNGDSWAAYDPVLNAYHKYPEMDTWFIPVESTPGKGYWASFITPAEPLGYALKQDSEVIIKLNAGWNIIGNPYVTPLKWETAKIKVRATGTATWSTMADSGDLIRKYAIGWDPASAAYYPIAEDITEGVVNYFQPWQGVWIKAFSDCELAFTPPAAPAL